MILATQRLNVSNGNIYQMNNIYTLATTRNLKCPNEVCNLTPIPSFNHLWGKLQFALSYV